jgi:hypothetical protein
MRDALAQDPQPIEALAELSALFTSIDTNQTVLYSSDHMIDTSNSEFNKRE